MGKKTTRKKKTPAPAARWTVKRVCPKQGTKRVFTGTRSAANKVRKKMESLDKKAAFIVEPA